MYIVKSGNTGFIDYKARFVLQDTDTLEGVAVSGEELSKMYKDVLYCDGTMVLKSGVLDVFGDISMYNNRVHKAGEHLFLDGKCIDCVMDNTFRFICIDYGVIFSGSGNGACVFSDDTSFKFDFIFENVFSLGCGVIGVEMLSVAGEVILYFDMSDGANVLCAYDYNFALPVIGIVKPVYSSFVNSHASQVLAKHALLRGSEFGKMTLIC